MKKLLKFDKEFDSIGLKSQRRHLKELPQKGTTTVKADAKRDALRAGKRVSKTGKVYWETRKNRSDKAGSRV